jgi:uncharacterized membrane protein YqaE (UPF0057 family)
MRYVLAIFAPPIAVLSTGAFFSAVLCFFLTIIFAVPGMMHAWYIVSEFEAKKAKANI